jgi:hypothetical protein
MLSIGFQVLLSHQTGTQFGLVFRIETQGFEKRYGDFSIPAYIMRVNFTSGLIMEFLLISVEAVRSSGPV